MTVSLLSLLTGDVGLTVPLDDSVKQIQKPEQIHLIGLVVKVSYYHS